MLVRKAWADSTGDACEWEYEGKRRESGKGKETESVTGWSLGDDGEQVWREMWGGWGRLEVTGDAGVS